jgi:hypothetical protein
MAYVVTRDGVTTLKVPDLNLFDVARQRIDGRREVYTNIEVGEPDAVLFRPPSDAVVNSKGNAPPA